MNVKNAINIVFSIGISIPYCFIKRVKRDGVDFFMTEACHIAENSQYQLAFRKIPKKYDDVPMLDYRTNISYAIVMQRYIKIKKNATRREFSKLMIAPEVYIMKNYFQLLGCTGDDTIKDYWTGVKSNLICVSRKDLDIVWPKYEDRYRMHHYYGNYFEDDSIDKLKTENFDFENWINLYSGILQYRPEYEKYADVIFK